MGDAHTCRNRHCPGVGAAAKDGLRPQADLLPVGYTHVASRCPPRSPIAYQNKPVLCDPASAPRRKPCQRSPPIPSTRRRIGATAVLHSWGSAMTHHPHVHKDCAGRRIPRRDVRWCAVSPASSAGVGAFRLFRRLFRAALTDAHAAGRLASSVRSRALSSRGLRRVPRTANVEEVVCLRQAALRRA
jgi:hypothetical protein